MKTKRRLKSAEENVTEAIRILDWLLARKPEERTRSCTAQVRYLLRRIGNQIKGQKEVSTKTLMDLFCSRRFSDWYMNGGSFDRFITGDFKKGETIQKAEKAAIKDLEKMLSR